MPENLLFRFLTRKDSYLTAHEQQLLRKDLKFWIQKLGFILTRLSTTRCGSDCKDIQADMYKFSCNELHFI